jgi:O-antigen ligase
MTVTLGYLLVRMRCRIPLLRLAAVVAVIGVIVLIFLPEEYGERLMSLVTERSTDPSLRRRLSYNIIGLDLFRQSPLWGIGPGSFPTHYAQLAYRFVGDAFGGPRMLHNTFLSIGCELGLLGLGLFLALVFVSLRDLRFVAAACPAGTDDALKRAAEALEIAMVAFFISSFFLPNEHQKYMWVMFAACAAMARMRRESLADFRPNPKSEIRSSNQTRSPKFET